MQKYLMIFDLDGTLADRRCSPHKSIEFELLNDLHAALKVRDIELDLIVVSSSCYESARNWLKNIPPGLFSALYFENGAVKVSRNKLELLLDENTGEFAAVKNMLEAYFMSWPLCIRSISWKKFTISVELSDASNLLAIEDGIAQLLKPKNWEVTCSDKAKLELIPSFLKKNFALNDWLKTRGGYKKILCVGDKFYPAGNDYALLEDERVDVAVEVASIEDTRTFIKNIIQQKFGFDARAAISYTTARLVEPASRQKLLNENDNARVLARSVSQGHLFFDFDGTLTNSDGHIEPDCVQAMWDLQSSGHHLWVITGRSFGWCDALAQILPLEGILGENGAFALYWSDGKLVQWKSSHIAPDFSRQRDNLRAALQDLGFPIHWASDQTFRCYDLAICTNEHGWVMRDKEIEALIQCCEQHRAEYSLSSIHLNIWFGAYNKASSLVQFMADTQGMGAADLEENAIFFGDSPNDEPMFRLIRKTYGVANIARFLPGLRYRPEFISRLKGGLGTAQLLKDIFPSVAVRETKLSTLPSAPPRYSLVLPCFESVEKLHNTLLSIAKAVEKYSREIEVVLVDNNSVGCSKIASVVESFRNRMNVLLIHQPQLTSSFSLCSARNRGVQNARGEYVFFTDADCMLMPDCFDRLDAFLGTLPAAGVSIVTGERIFVRVPETVQDMDEEFFKNLPRCPSASNYSLIEDRRFPWMRQLPDVSHPWNFVHGCFFLIRRSDYLALGGSDLAYDGYWGYEDIDLAWRAVTQLNAKIHFCSDTAVYHQEFEDDLQSLQKNNYRFNKQDNPNWHRICALIPGFEKFKASQFSTLGINPNT